mgnify:CR=1 FL=1
MADPKMVNLTSIDLNYEVVNGALNGFTDKTGIPIVIVAPSFDEAWKKAYELMNTIKFDGMFYRKDIGLPGAAESGKLNKKKKADLRNLGKA